MRVDPKLERWSVEYNLTEHCNLHCYACDHASPLLPRRFADLDEFQRDLTALGTVLQAEELRLVGGEPLLHPRLLDFLEVGRSIGIAARMVVITNGVLLHRMPERFWALIDDLRLSLYPGVELSLGLDACAVICAERGIRFAADAKGNRFQRSLLNSPIDDPELVNGIFLACEMARSISCHTVHDGRFYLCPVAPFMAPRLALLGIDLDNQEEDGVALHANPDLRIELERCLDADVPLAACRYCLGTLAPWTPHRQMDGAARQAWLAEDHRDLIEELRRRMAEGR